MAGAAVASQPKQDVLFGRSGLSKREAVALDVFPCLLDVAEAMLLSGADVHFVEEKLADIGRAYGAYKMNVFVITSSIIATMTLPNGYEHTLTRRVIGEASIDFDKVERLATLCTEAGIENYTYKELKARLKSIRMRTVPTWSLLLGGILSAGAFALFFGGSYLDAAVSATFAIFICLALKFLRPWTPSTIIFNFLNSFLCGLGIMAADSIWGGISPDMVMIGDIMLLIPGVAMTNATRDMFSGDTVSGIMRFVESLLWAIALALGFMAAIWLAQVIW